MARGGHWSGAEIAVTVEDYMKMLTLELAGQSYIKAVHRRSLLTRLDDRSAAAVELKHQNISAVLRDMGCVWIPGYKPRGNYQAALADFVEEWINSHPEFDDISRIAVEKPAFVPSELDFSRISVDAPVVSSRVGDAPGNYNVVRLASKRDYLAREARNAALGNAGELFILQYEEYRLRSIGKKHLAERIEHVASTKGDGLGFDVLSFDASGKERFIEVKTTAFAKETPFFASRNEVRFSEDAADQFHLYRLFDFRRAPKLFSLNGNLANHCTLDPISYICRF